MVSSALYVDELTTSHLLITRPTESNALESFVLQRAEDSAHMAMLVGSQLSVLASS